MKNIKYNYPKSSFLNIEKDLGIILEKILQNDRLKKLLYYNNTDALTKEKLDETATYGLINKQIKLVPKVKVDRDMLVYLIISFGDFVPNETNPEFRDNIVQFDIICHFDQWMLDDFQLRPYKIAAELDTMFNESRLTGIGTLQFLSGVQLSISGEEYAGVRLIYAAIHGEDDRVNAPNVASNADIAENFNRIFNPHVFEEKKVDIKQEVKKEDE